MRAFLKRKDECDGDGSQWPQWSPGLIIFDRSKMSDPSMLHAVKCQNLIFLFFKRKRKSEKLEVFIYLVQRGAHIIHSDMYKKMQIFYSAHNCSAYIKETSYSMLRMNECTTWLKVQPMQQ